MDYWKKRVIMYFHSSVRENEEAWKCDRYQGLGSQTGVRCLLTATHGYAFG